MMGAIVASGSRGGFLGFAAMLVVLAAFSVKKHPMFVMAGAVVVICALPLAPSSYWNRIASIADDSKDDVQSSQARRALMGQSLDAFMENPLTGVGAGCFKDWNPRGRSEAWHEAHNVWLQVAAELGIFGFAAFFFLVMRAFYSVFQTGGCCGGVPPKRREPRRRTPMTLLDDAFRGDGGLARRLVRLRVLRLGRLQLDLLLPPGAGGGAARDPA